MRSNVTLTNNSELQSTITQRPIDVSTVLILASSFIIENGTTFNLSSINATRDGGEYTCIVVNEAGTEATTATLYVHPTFTTQPMNQYVRPGDSVTLTCIADSFPAPNYQWQRMNMTTKQFQDLSGQTDTAYTIANIVHGDFSRYRCEVTAPTMNELLIANSSAAVITGKLFTINHIVNYVCCVVLFNYQAGYGNVIHASIVNWKYACYCKLNSSSVFANYPFYSLSFISQCLLLVVLVLLLALKHSLEMEVLLLTVHQMEGPILL